MGNKFCNFCLSFPKKSVHHRPWYKQSRGTVFLSASRPFSYSEKESQSNDTLLHFVEFSNVHNCDRSSNATRSNRSYKNI